jgi:hypothetical protein
VKADVFEHGGAEIALIQKDCLKFMPGRPITTC